jgi:uncharacterized protein (TIGR03435 family)
MALRRGSAFLVIVWLWASCAAFGQEKGARLAYEIASVRASDPNLEGGSVSPLPNGIGYNAVRVTVRDMLSVMYRVPQRQITGGPEWVYTEHFDVEGKADHAYSIDQLHVMFENLLEDRFNLKLHAVSRTGPVYTLTIAKTGLKMTAVNAGTDRHNPIVGSDDNHVTGDRVPMNYLCFWLGQNVQSDERPVVDRTGLTGTYSFTLNFRPQLEPTIAGGESGEAEDAPTIFEALRDQLGLELRAEKGPVTELVIDHIEKPSAN